MAKRKINGRTRANGAGSIWTDPVTGYLYALVTWTEIINGKGKRRRRKRRALNRTHAQELIPVLLAEAAAHRAGKIAEKETAAGSFWVNANTHALLKNLLVTLVEVLDRPAITQ